MIEHSMCACTKKKYRTQTRSISVWHKVSSFIMHIRGALVTRCVTQIRQQQQRMGRRPRRQTRDHTIESPYTHTAREARSVAFAYVSTLQLYHREGALPRARRARVFFKAIRATFCCSRGNLLVVLCGVIGVDY